MEQINMELEPTYFNQFKELVIEEEKTVEDLLEEMNMKELSLAVLIDGVKAEMDTVIKEGQKVVILPVIAGGSDTMEVKVFKGFLEGWEYVRDVACGGGLTGKMYKASIEFTGKLTDEEDDLEWTVRIRTS